MEPSTAKAIQVELSRESAKHSVAKRSERCYKSVAQVAPSNTYASRDFCGCGAVCDKNSNLAASITNDLELTGLNAITKPFVSTFFEDHVFGAGAAGGSSQAGCSGCSVCWEKEKCHHGGKHNTPEKCRKKNGVWCGFFQPAFLEVGQGKGKGSGESSSSSSSSSSRSSSRSGSTRSSSGSSSSGSSSGSGKKKSKVTRLNAPFVAQMASIYDVTALPKNPTDAQKDLFAAIPLFTGQTIGVSSVTQAGGEGEATTDVRNQLAFDVYVNCDDDKQVDICRDQTTTKMAINQVHVFRKRFKTCGPGARDIDQCVEAQPDPAAAAKDYRDNEVVHAVLGICRFQKHVHTIKVWPVAGDAAVAGYPVDTYTRQDGTMDAYTEVRSGVR